MSSPRGDKTKSRMRRHDNTTRVSARLPAADLTLLDAWIVGQSEPRLSRSEAMRRLLTQALSKPSNADPPNVDAILFPRISSDGQFARMGFTSGGKEIAFSMSPALLASFTLAALAAKTSCEERANSADKAQSLDAFICEKWEFRLSVYGNAMFLCFRLVGGAWIRLQVSSQAADPMRDALEKIAARLKQLRDQAPLN